VGRATEQLHFGRTRQWKEPPLPSEIVECVVMMSCMLGSSTTQGCSLFATQRKLAKTFFALIKTDARFLKEDDDDADSNSSRKNASESSTKSHRSSGAAALILFLSGFPGIRCLCSFESFTIVCVDFSKKTVFVQSCLCARSGSD